MQLTLAFDVYGTLIDTNGVTTRLREMIGDRAEEFVATWRQKQLEYSFRRGLMQQYVSFDVCIEQALDYSDAYFETAFSQGQKQALLALYTRLPAFPEVLPALREQELSQFRRFAFSNGRASSLRQLLDNAALTDCFDSIISAEPVKCFKPAPAVYQFFLQQAASESAQTWLVSSNSFDILGANAQGWKTVWLNRGNLQTFDCWAEKPTVIINSLEELTAAIHLFYQ